MITCEQCGDVIGVYEPLVAVVDGKPHETSRAADPALVAASAERYHRSCYAGRTGTRD